MALNTFLPQYKTWKSIPQTTPSPEVSKVAFPLIYQVTRDNRSHYVLGVVHPMPISDMPSFILEIMEHCQCLLTEGVARIPSEIQQKLIKESLYHPNYKTYLLEQIIDKKAFANDMQLLLNLYDIKQNLENISGMLLCHLFLNYLSKRLDPSQLRIEEEIISQFKQSNKRIVELNEKLLNAEIFRSLLDTDGALTVTSNGISYKPIIAAIDLLTTLTEQINDYYRDPLMYFKDNLAQKMISDFYNNDLENKQVTLEEEDACLNKEWVKIFEDTHEESKGSLLLVCGYGHLLNGDLSVLSLLKAKGFTIKRVQAAPEEIKRLRPMTLC